MISGWWKRAIGWLFDTSLARRNRQEVEDILIAALTHSHGDSDFLPALHRILVEWERGAERGRNRFFNFQSFMNQHRRPGDPPEAWRLRAHHLIEDLPDIYGHDPPKPTS